MTYLDSHVIPGLEAHGLTVVDLRSQLPRNTQWPNAQAWSWRPLSAIQLIVWHYPARPLRPDGPYDEVERIFAFARGHIAADWGNGWHAPTITYSTVIGGSGVVYLCNEWEHVTWHANDANGIGLGFMVDVGEGQDLTREQITSGEILADFVSNECPEIPADSWDHYGHGELTDYGNATACPGRLLPFIQTYRQYGDLERKALEEQEETMLTDQEREMVELARQGVTKAVLDTYFGRAAEIGLELLAEKPGTKTLTTLTAKRRRAIGAELAAFA